MSATSVSSSPVVYYLGFEKKKKNLNECAREAGDGCRVGVAPRTAGFLLTNELWLAFTARNGKRSP